jgi:peptidoglycan-N-acetylglucosamine deacetylase
VSTANWLPPYLKNTLRTTNERTLESVDWPRGARCAVSIHVHVDGQTVWRGLGMEKLVYISSGEFGPRTAIWRVLSVLANHDIRGSFFIPGWTAENYPDMVRAISAAGHEVGHHNYSHTLTDLGRLHDGTWDRGVEEREFKRALAILEELSGQHVQGFVPAGGELSPSTMEILLENSIKYEAQCSADDIPYWWMIDGKPTGLLEIPTHWSIDDAPQFLYTLFPQMGLLKSPGEVYAMWKDDFDAFRHFGRCMVIQLHPQWIGRAGRIMMFDKLLEYMCAFDDVWWATGAEIAAYWGETYPPETIERLLRQ